MVNLSAVRLWTVSYTHLAQLVKEVATKTNDVAGDGTTTATVLAQAMVCLLYTSRCV